MKVMDQRNCYNEMLRRITKANVRELLYFVSWWQVRKVIGKASVCQKGG